MKDLRRHVPGRTPIGNDAFKVADAEAGLLKNG